MFEVACVIYKSIFSVIVSILNPGGISPTTKKHFCPFSQGVLHPKIMLCYFSLTVFLPGVVHFAQCVSMPSWHSCSECFAFCDGLESVLPQAYCI